MSAAIAAIPAIVKAAPAIVSTAILHPEAAMAFVESTISNFTEPVQPPIPTNDPYVYGAEYLGSQLGARIRDEYDSLVDDYNEVFNGITVTNSDTSVSDSMTIVE